MANRPSTHLFGEIRPAIIFSAFLLLAALWFSPLLIALGKPVILAQGETPIKDDPLLNNELAYPRLGITAPFTPMPETSPLRYGDWKKFRVALRSGIALSFETETLPEAPLIFASGHSSDRYPHTYSSIFASLNQAEVGDTVKFRYEDSVYQFTVIDKKIITPKDVTEFEKLVPETSEKQRLALVTCWPLMTTTNRLVVLAERDR